MSDSTGAVYPIAGGVVDPDRPRLKHRPDAKFPWQIVRRSEQVRLTDVQMGALVAAYLAHEGPGSQWPTP